MICIRKEFEPDYANLVSAAQNRMPRRLPMYEHLAVPSIVGTITGEKLADLGGPVSDADLRHYYDTYCRFYRMLGYDTPSFECCAREIMPGGGALDNHMIKGAISTRGDFDRYDWDCLTDLYFEKFAGHFDAMRAVMPKGMKAVGGVGNGVFECVQDCVGFMDLCYMRDDDFELYKSVFAACGEMLYRIWDRFLDMYDDVFCVYRMGDDLGYKAATMLSPEDIRALVIPQYARIISLIRRKTNKPFLMHSCGKIFEVMDDLIKVAGIDAKHSNEDVIAPFSEWVRLYKDRIGLFGGIDTDALCDVSGIDLDSYMPDLFEAVRNRPGIALGCGNSITHYVSVDRYTRVNDMIRTFRGE